MDEVGRYYDELAATYDARRFGNTYGAFVDARERAVLADWLRGIDPATTLDAGCGTGRMLGFAQHGVDGSTKMIDVARAKWPDRELAVADLRALPFADGTFAAVICLHVFMHLPRGEVAACVGEFRRVVKPGGVIIFDVPAAERRTFLRRQRKAWHGGTAFAARELPTLAQGLQIVEVTGLLTIPVHRVPPPLRSFLQPADAWLGARAPRLASYYLVRCTRAHLKTPPITSEDSLEAGGVAQSAHTTSMSLFRALPANQPASRSLGPRL